jgi:CDP-diacylglycerol---serine O-phosphatidyltransferase
MPKKPRVPTDPAMRALRAERRRARLKVLPTLCTLANGVCGFAAIIQVAAVQYDPVAKTILNPENFVHAGWLILLAMVFDALDGRIARMTQTTGDFGGELDSLCDAISFGVAPAVMVAMMNAQAISSPIFAKVAWLFGAAFACGAILRLARFNVENSHDEESHMSFKGLPSPAAAGAIVSAVLFQGFLRDHGWTTAASLVATALPFVALAVGYLMVSTLRYTHVPNRYLRGRKSVRKIAQLVFVGLLLFAIFPEPALAFAFAAFAASGPIGRLIEIGRVAQQVEGGVFTTTAAPVSLTATIASTEPKIVDVTPTAPPIEMKPPATATTAARSGDTTIRLDLN